MPHEVSKAFMKEVRFEDGTVLRLPQDVVERIKTQNLKAEAVVSWWREASAQHDDDHLAFEQMDVTIDAQPDLAVDLIRILIAGDRLDRACAVRAAFRLERFEPGAGAPYIDQLRHDDDAYVKDWANDTGDLLQRVRAENGDLSGDLERFLFPDD
jgi:hypothetical protein